MSTLLILYSVWCKVVTLSLGWYIVKLRKQLKEKLKGPVGYVCSTDLAHELSWEPEGVGSSIIVHDRLKEAQERECTKQCGITKVRLVTMEVVQETDWQA